MRQVREGDKDKQEVMYKQDGNHLQTKKIGNQGLTREIERKDYDL